MSTDDSVRHLSECRWDEYEC